jgi:hypothetical protein
MTTLGMVRVDVVGGLRRGPGVVGRRVAVPVAAPDALVAARAERPPAVLGARSVAGEDHGGDVRGHAGVVHHPVQLVDGVRAEGVAHLRPVEGDAHHGQVALLLTGPVDAPVVRDVREPLEAGDEPPPGGVEGLGHRCRE